MILHGLERRTPLMASHGSCARFEILVIYRGTEIAAWLDAVLPRDCRLLDVRHVIISPSECSCEPLSIQALNGGPGVLEAASVISDICPAYAMPCMRFVSRISRAWSNKSDGYGVRECLMSWRGVRGGSAVRL
jgi:hypothetical protein